MRVADLRELFQCSLHRHVILPPDPPSGRQAPHMPVYHSHSVPTGRFMQFCAVL